MSVFEKILAQVPIGLKLKTPSLNHPFTIKKIDSEKVTFFIKSIEIEVLKESWNGIPKFLGNKWVNIGANHVNSTKLDPYTLEKYLRDHTPPNKKHSQGSYVASLLEYIGLVEIDRARPAKIKMRGISP